MEPSEEFPWTALRFRGIAKKDLVSRLVLGQPKSGVRRLLYPAAPR
jgi:hypothetical protein